ncbi:pectate lyase family protein [Hymenobacter polaris]|uniref:pectate lyase family protein n=1 Tax=Hymenobacter polaris TaxID=2682546 RepID=UPI0018A32621|nr:pectate lyase [Hymenobacter polaris]
MRPVLPPLLLALAAIVPAAAQLPAFPGAEGAGKYTSGGRGTPARPTTVLEVTSLADDNTPGTLRYALEQPAKAVGPRTVVFRVAGTIHLAQPLTVPANTTVAGQSAPGQGICLADQPVRLKGNNIIVRFIRVRMGDRFQNKGKVDEAGSDDALGGTRNHRLVLDHCSLSWSTDEVCSVYAGDSVSVQWCLLSEPLNYSYHFETGDQDFEQHGFGGIWGGRHASFHHNLLAHCKGRNPRFDGSRNLEPRAAGQENVDFVNNVIYDWGAYSTNGGEGGNYNLVGNYYKPGPSTESGSSAGVPIRAMIMTPFRKLPLLPYPHLYLAGNYVDGAPATTKYNWLGIAPHEGTRADTAGLGRRARFNLPLVPTQPAQEAYELVLTQVGCTLPARDALDQRVVQDVRRRTGRLIDVQGNHPHGTAYAATAAAWPDLGAGPAPAPDTDHDGMPDAWERQHHLNPADPADRAAPAPDGYPWLESYLNSVAAPTSGK